MKKLIPILLAVFAWYLARKTRTWTNWTMSIWYSPVMTLVLSSMTSVLIISPTAS